MLLPYEADNYYARSSGILVECLAAGIPVVVPSATWLSRQFIREVYRHQESLHQAMKSTEFFSDSEILWKRHNSEVSPFVNGELLRRFLQLDCDLHIGLIDAFQKHHAAR